MRDHSLKRRCVVWLESRFFLRFHIALILLGSFLAGLLASAVMLRLGVTAMPSRYGLAVMIAYVAFLGLVRLWIAYVRTETSERAGLDGDLADVVDTGLDAADLGRGLLHGDAAPHSGVSASWASPGASHDGGGSASEALGDALSADELGVVLAFVVMVLALVGSGLYLLYIGPTLLSEAAASALLAGSLARRTRRLEQEGWTAGVARATVWPLVGVFVTMVAFGLVVDYYLPGAVRLRDVIAALRH